MSIAHFIDHTLLKPTCTAEDIEKICAEAKTYGFATVCIPPYFIKKSKKFLKEVPVGVATVIGFPFGYSHHKAKVREVEKAIKDGADELDMVINITALKAKDFDYLRKEIETISGITSKESKVLKLIIESGVLGDEEIIRCCELYKEYPVQFLKTSTGYAEKGASVEAVTLMRKHLPSHIHIKASGGIRTYEFAKQLIDAGATRLGCSASVAIVTNEKASNAGY